MELWEFNAYVKGYNEVLFNERSNIFRLAYYTAFFNNSRSAKSLEYYLNKLDIEFHKDEYKDIKVDVNKSRNIHNTIQRLKQDE